MSYPQRTPVPKEFTRQGLATQPQINYICSLLDKKNLYAWPLFFDRANAMDAEEYAAYVQSIKDALPTISRQRASAIITTLKSLPYPPAEDRDKLKLKTSGEQLEPQGGTVFQQSLWVNVEFVHVTTDDGKAREYGVIKHRDAERGVLAGSYGVSTVNDKRYSNDTTFFKVWAAKEFGRGWGVKMYVSDDLARVRLSYDAQVDAIKAIAADPESAARLFGHEFKRCGVCGRGLTNDLSRELGIGPVCRQRVGSY